MELLVGDQAPQLRVKAFIKGPTIATFVPGKTHVVEFWATWCGPCRRCIPHLTALQTRHPSVRVLAVAVKEPDADAVKAFVNQQGEAMAYDVAIDADFKEMTGGAGWCYVTWCQAAFRSGIPASFIIDGDGRVAWIGHPLELDEPLALIEAGQWDLASASSDYRNRLDEKKVREIFSLHQATGVWKRDGDAERALATFDGVFSQHPELEARMGTDRLSILVDSDLARALSYARHLAHAVGRGNEDLLFDVARLLIDAASKAANRHESPVPEILALSLEVLTAVNAALKDPSLARNKMMIHNQFARAQLFSGNREVAAFHAGEAVAVAIEAGMPAQVIKDLEVTKAACFRTEVCPPA